MRPRHRAVRDHKVDGKDDRFIVIGQTLSDVNPSVVSAIDSLVVTTDAMCERNESSAAEVGRSAPKVNSQ